MANALMAMLSKRVYPFLYKDQHPSNFSMSHTTTKEQGGGTGFIAGQFPGVVTVDGAPARRYIECRRRSNNRRVVASQWSNTDGTYKFDELNIGEEFDLIARDHNRVYRDIIVPGIKPWQYELTFDLQIPSAFTDPTFVFSTSIRGGQPPYSLDDISTPAGITVSLDVNILTISGVSASHGQIEFTISDNADNQIEVVTQHLDLFSAPNRYWRIFITGNNGGGSDQSTIICELEMSNTPGGPNLCSGGSGIASTNYNSWGWTLAGAFDGNKTSFPNGWAATPHAAPGGVPAYLGYVFPAPVSINEVRITSRNDSLQAYSPKDFIIQSSENGVDWLDHWAVSNQTGWTAGEERTFTRP